MAPGVDPNYYFVRRKFGKRAPGPVEVQEKVAIGEASQSALGLSFIRSWRPPSFSASSPPDEETKDRRPAAHRWAA